MPESRWGLVTRAVAPTASASPISDASALPAMPASPSAGAAAAPGLPGGGDAADGLSATWWERFLVVLPQALCEQLLRPAPGDNQFAGVPLQVRGCLRVLYGLTVPLVDREV